MALHTGPLDMEGAGIPGAHVEGIDLAYRAPGLSAEDREALPAPVLDDRPEWVDLYWRAWAVAFDKVREPVAGSGFVSPFVDEGFSDNIFQWDSCFMVCFARYAAHRLPIAGTLDNFYAKQHDDGFICREINERTGADFWSKDHPSTVNPPLFSWAEWELFQITGDRDRLRRVLPGLAGYYAWLKQHRRHADGIGYWTTSLASGMDNSPRAFEQGGECADEHYGYAWLCMTAQQALNARLLASIAGVIGDAVQAAYFEAEYATLAAYVNDRMWDEAAGFYYDVAPDGARASVRTPAACWPVLAGIATHRQVDRILGHLFDPAAFWRPHALPSLSADHVLYHPRGNYWQGGVWAPLVYLVVRALEAADRHAAAVRVAENHIANVHEVYTRTGTFWESYAAESAAPGNIARPEFVGWTGCGPVACLIETVLGLQVYAPERRIRWHLSQPGRHGVERLRMGEGVVSLLFVPGADGGRIDVASDVDFVLDVCRGTFRRRYQVAAGRTALTLRAD